MSRGSRCRDWFSGSGSFCTGGIPACRAGSRDRRASPTSRPGRPRERCRRLHGRGSTEKFPRCRSRRGYRRRYDRCPSPLSRQGLRRPSGLPDRVRRFRGVSWLRTRRRRVSSCVSPQTSLLEPVSPGNKSRKFPEHLLTGKHCTLTLHVKAASFASPFFIRGCCGAPNRRVAMQRDACGEMQENTETGLPSMLQDWAGANSSPDPRGEPEKESNRKKSEMRGVILAAVLAMIGYKRGSARRTPRRERRFLPYARPVIRSARPQKTALVRCLNGIIGRPAGTYPGYSYSTANKNSGLTWDEATFRDYIKDPRAKIPGTKMIYPGSEGRAENQRPSGLPQAVRCGRQKEISYPDWRQSAL